MTPLPDVRMVPDADFLVVYADAPDLDAFLALLSRKGTLVLLLQGFGVPGNQRVASNLRSAGRTLATARWLAAAGRRYGCRAAHVPYGVDREIQEQFPDWSGAARAFEQALATLV